MRSAKIIKLLFLLTLNCLATSTGLWAGSKAEAQDYLVGTWAVDGSDLFIQNNSAFKFTGGTNPLLVIEQNGSGFVAHLNEDIFVGEINCNVPKSLTLLAITPQNSTNLSVDVTAPFPFLCSTHDYGVYHLDILNVASDNNSFTTCRTDKKTQCATWVRDGTKPPTSNGNVCKKGAVGLKAPLAKVSGKSVTITNVTKDTGLKSGKYFACTLTHKASTKAKTIKYNLTGKGKITKGGLASGFWAVQCTENCASGGSGTLVATGFKIK